MRAAFATLGCKVNHYETEAMSELFTRAGWEVVPFGGQADVYVVNTCTVTAVSDAKSRQLISKAHANNPGALIAAVGCYAQSDAAAVAALPGVGLVVGTDGRKDIVERVNQALLGNRGELVGNAFDAHAFEPLSAVRDGRTRATLKIQDGCTNFCTYCIIPYVRGRLRSRPLAEVEKELFTLSAEGYREVVLTGIHLASYGKDLGDCDLLSVLELCRRIDGVERVRLGSLEPGFVDERFAEAAAKNGKLCDQFHLSLQSGSDAVLLRMRRRYTAAEFAGSCAFLREARPGCAITTDVIAGFPGETEAEHAESMAYCERIGFSRMHVFPYSVRPGTVAAQMPGQLTKREKERRAGELIAVGKRLSADYLLSQVGRKLPVLIEADGAGYAENYVRVRAETEPGRVLLPGEIVNLRIVRIENETAVGREV